MKKSTSTQGHKVRSFIIIQTYSNAASNSSSSSSALGPTDFNQIAVLSNSLIQSFPDALLSFKNCLAFSRP